MRKETARTVVELSSITFIETMALVVLVPSFVLPITAFVAACSLVTAVVVTFDNFYDDPSKGK